MGESWIEGRLRLVSEGSAARDEILMAWDALMRESKLGPAWERAERVEAAAWEVLAAWSGFDVELDDACKTLLDVLEARAESNGKPQDDDTPKDQPDPRQPGPNVLAWAGSLAAQGTEIEALTTQRDALAAAVDEALNLLDADQPLQAGLVLMRARG